MVNISKTIIVDGNTSNLLSFFLTMRPQIICPVKSIHTPSQFIIMLSITFASSGTFAH